MSLLNFLRVIDGIQRRGGKDAPPPRNRRLEVESLERRAVLAVLDVPLVLSGPLESTTSATTLELSPLTDPLPPPPEETLSPDVGGSSSGTGEPEPSDPSADPPTDPPLTDGGSGSGSGESNIAPQITLGSQQNSGMWVWFTGTVSDPDGPVQGLTVYFTIGLESSISFTATVQADGTYESLEMMLAAGTTISAYTIDVDGIHSTLATCSV
jgi:hypothetical protein